MTKTEISYSFGSSQGIFQKLSTVWSHKVAYNMAFHFPNMLQRYAINCSSLNSESSLMFSSSRNIGIFSWSSNIHNNSLTRAAVLHCVTVQQNVHLPSHHILQRKVFLSGVCLNETDCANKISQKIV